MNTTAATVNSGQDFSSVTPITKGAGTAVHIAYKNRDGSIRSSVCDAINVARFRLQPEGTAVTCKRCLRIAG